ncbi:MAG TPA: hypothetical protein VHO25_18345 [Polyangiaceae bacterium]|nr:hypothetical protein [Polyangiaceae bacterium]
MGELVVIGARRHGKHHAALESLNAATRAFVEQTIKESGVPPTLAEIAAFRGVTLAPRIAGQLGAFPRIVRNLTAIGGQTGDSRLDRSCDQLSRGYSAASVASEVKTPEKPGI